jgi:preprotein translocase subunit SecD
LVDLFVVFFFTKPIVTILAGVQFFASGHPLSGLSPKSIGMKPITNQVSTSTLEA